MHTSQALLLQQQQQQQHVCYWPQNSRLQICCFCGEIIFVHVIDYRVFACLMFFSFWKDIFTVEQYMCKFYIGTTG